MASAKAIAQLQSISKFVGIGKRDDRRLRRRLPSGVLIDQKLKSAVSLIAVSEECGALDANQRALKHTKPHPHFLKKYVAN